MFDDFIRHVQVLSKVNSLIARMWLGIMARRLALLAFAGLIAAFGLAMGDVAGFFWLQAPLGSVWAAAIVAFADFVLAAVVALYAGTAKPGSEIELAMEVRSLALRSLREDADNLEAAVKTLAEQVRDAKDTISGLVTNPLDAAAQKLLVPAIIAMIKGLRARPSKGDQARGG